MRLILYVQQNLESMKPVKWYKTFTGAGNRQIIMSNYDIREYIKTQQQETYRAFIIYGPGMGHKTALARQMAAQLGVYLFDLQAHFGANPDLAGRINTFGPRDLESLLLKLELPERVVVVDNLDFLLNTWSNSHKRKFIDMVDIRLKFGVTHKTFIFMIQPDPFIIRHELKNTRGQPRLLPLDSFFAL